MFVIGGVTPADSPSKRSTGLGGVNGVDLHASAVTRAGRAAVAETRLDVVVEEEGGLSVADLLDRLRHEVHSAQSE